jgi:hypothetical protein
MKMRGHGWLPSGIIAALLVPAVAHAGAIASNTALPVHDGELILRQQVIWARSTGDPTPAARELDAIAAPTVLFYGVDADLMLMGVLPFLYKRIAVTTAGGRVTRQTTGFGDLSAIARYTILARDAPGRTFRVAPFGGVKIPTGAQNEADALGRFPQPFQLGSGSWDPLAGAIVTWQTLRWELDLSATYQLRTEANAFRAGDEARGDGSIQYRLVPWRSLGPGVPSYVFGVVESSVVWNGRDEISGVVDPDSGGFSWYVAPGLQWISLRTVVEAAVQIPVARNSNGRGLKNDFVAVLSFRQSF